MLAVLCIGILIGGMLGMSGAGGGIVAVPLLLIAGFSASEAVSASLIGVGLIAILASAIHSKNGTIAWTPALILGLSAIAGAPLGNRLAQVLPELLVVLSFIMVSLLAAWRMWRGGCRFVSNDPEAQQEMHIHHLLFSGVATGIMAGLFGVGGGFLMVPVLLANGVSIRTAMPLSLAVIALASLSALSDRYWQDASIAWEAGLALASSGIPAWLLGHHYAEHMRSCRLKETFSIAVLCVLCLMACRFFCLPA